MVWDFWLDLVSFLWSVFLLDSPVETSLGVVFPLDAPAGNSLDMPQ